MMDTSEFEIQTPVIAGNWKMHMTPSEARAFGEAFAARYAPHDNRTVILFPPAISFAATAEALSERSDLRLGIQNIHWEDSGAFTGETSAAMARDAGARFVLIGHSERRHVFNESDADVGRKVDTALEHRLVPVACVGETLEEREAGRLEEVLLRQIDAIIQDLPGEHIERLVIAYEPVWAIGTGVNATPEDASSAHAVLRARLAERTDDSAARRIPILYGGSVNPENAPKLLAADYVDGVLVGGASLDPESFAAIATS